MSLLQLFHDPLDLAWGTQGFQIVTEKRTECESPCGDWEHADSRQGTGYQAGPLCLFSTIISTITVEGKGLFFCCQSKVSRNLSHKVCRKKINPHPHKPLSAPHPHKSNHCPSMCEKSLTGLHGANVLWGITIKMEFRFLRWGGTYLILSNKHG